MEKLDFDLDFEEIQIKILLKTSLNQQQENNPHIFHSNKLESFKISLE